MGMLEAQLGRGAYVVGDAFTMADIPLGIMAYRYWQLVPQHPAHPNLKRWYQSLEKREPFRTHVASVSLT
jgi:glutathione S-transferase